MSTTRREFLKQSLFGGLAIGGMTIPEMISTRNSAIEEANGQIAPKSRAKSALAIAFGDVYHSTDFQLRYGKEFDVDRSGITIATDGTLITFMWTCERYPAHGYIKEWSDEINPDRIVFRLRMGRPEAPYYLRWKNGDYYLYTPPGTLVKRAASMIRENTEDATLQALSDMRMAVLINLTFTGQGQDVLDELCELDKRIRETNDLAPFWESYKRLLSKTNPAGSAG